MINLSFSAYNLMRKKRFLALLILLFPIYAHSASKLELGWDWRLRHIAISNPDGNSNTEDRLNYSSSRMRFYIITILTQDIEAVIRIQSIKPWGTEGTNTPNETRYPNADGTPWLESAYVKVPHIMGMPLDLTVGRQPIVIGDGLLISDDELGFNAIRLQSILPFQLGREVPLQFSIDVFTAKVKENLNGAQDADLNAGILSARWGRLNLDALWMQDANKANMTYLLGRSTITTSSIIREIIGFRLFSNLKDAYYKGEFGFQSGTITKNDGTEIDLSGSVFVVGVGGGNNHKPLRKTWRPI